MVLVFPCINNHRTCHVLLLVYESESIVVRECFESSQKTCRVLLLVV
ncbi:hypothetical protein HanXRQr2_Chr16g0754631 [Helianthus annuus]|uniref:Uncharacterized protein n=1 Tax=Helianthus annuus TaxID=4232 RepID=A0A9K3DTQ2_HELAN|nr:hypothetical protein HanXRQr2_Chr16g0754631 [Helianthus annuus]